jgi:CubicO group peptidase (beta-lactamase class C family)/PKD repeat protein
MKKALYILVLFLLAAVIADGQQVCCPEFSLQPYTQPCADTAQHYGEGGHYDQGKPPDLSACKHTAQAYRVTPDKPGYTYTWIVTGGAVAFVNGNPMQITWGNGTEGSITVIVSNQEGTCRDTITKTVSLKDAPVAGFTFNPGSPVCLNQQIQFANTSSGASSYYWDFGDGSSSSLAVPEHTYTTAGTYVVMLVVSNGYAPKPGPTNESVKECGCTDTLRKTITVKGESAITIIPGCKQMLCKGDTAVYCTASQCGNYNWSVTGGRILTSSGACVTVIWDGSYPASVTMSGNCGSACGNSATLDVPVLYPTMPVSGNTIVCASAFTSYSLPAMPGTFYKWKLSGGGNISGPDSNTSVINIAWGTAAGSYSITCDYYNPLTKCSGSATINVKILPPYKITGLTNFCVGNNFSFVANGNGNWTVTPATGSTPSSLSAGNIMNGVWNIAGAYTVSVTPTTPSNFCSYPAVLNVIVLDTPKLNAIVGGSLVCPGGSSVYSVSSNMDDGMFTWSVTGGVVMSTMGNHHDSLIIKWNSTGPYSLTVYQTVNGCVSSAKVLLVNPLAAPTIVSGPSTSCMDNAVTYTASGPASQGGYNWTLSNSLGTITTGQGTNTINVQWHGALPPASSTSVVTVTTCGGSDSRTVSIISAPPVTISSVNNFCSGPGITLAASVSGATSYAWQHNGIPMPSTYNTQSILIVNPGTYIVTIADVNGCTSIGSISVPAENLSISASISTTDKVVWNCDETINTTLLATPSSGYCYQWFKAISPGIPGSPIPGATNSTYTATNLGVFWCEVTACGTSCKALTDTVKIIKYGCTGGGGSCDPVYERHITYTPCNPYSFTGSTTPVNAVGFIEWYFGDGDQAFGNTVTHQYKDTGSYLACAILGGNGYCRRDTCFIVHVTIAAKFKSTVNCNTVNFVNLSKAALPATYSWIFVGGSPSSSNLQHPPPVTYAAGGLQSATVTISDGTCTVTYTDTFTTFNVNAVMNIPTPVCAKTQAPFSVTGSNPNVSYQWNFGDGYISNLANTTHSYLTAGNYTVKLIVTDVNGCSATSTQVINVLPELTAMIGADKYICPGSTVVLNAPSSFTTWQWYRNGVPVAGATASSFTTGLMGEYSVAVSNGNGCAAASNHMNVMFSASPIAKIKASTVQCTGMPVKVQNISNESGVTYSWSATGPSTVSFSPGNSFNPAVAIAGSVPGEYQFSITAVNSVGCISRDTLCITLSQTPTVSVAGPTGSLCEGQVHIFTATASPANTSETYFYQWSNGVTGNTLSVGKAGAYNVVVQNSSGCTATAFAGTIKKLPDVSLFPVGCDTLCWTDTLRFPLPQPSSSAYTVTWYDNDGTAVANVGTGAILSLSALQPGMHHLHAVVSFAGGCAATTGVLDLYIKDCTLLPPCDNCSGLLESPVLEMKEMNSTTDLQVLQSNLTITILKPVKEIRISVADLQYYWKDSACNNCKIKMLERGCLFASTTNQALGTLLPDSTTALLLSGSAVTNCPGELVWKNATPLQPGTYAIPLTISLPEKTKETCKLIIKKLCLHVTLIDENCRSCDTRVCATQADTDDCKCNAGNNWTNLSLARKKPGSATPKNYVVCNTTITGYATNTPYILSGQYHCLGKCASVNNEITVYNQANQIIYNKTTAVVNEAISFPAAGTYSIKLTASCGTKKCICSFRIYITDNTCIDCPTPVDTTCVGCPPSNPPGAGGGGGGGPKDSLVQVIDSIVKTILPPCFTGEILIARNDTIIYERYIVCDDDTVTVHTAFDLASITKTFTAMAILKLMEEGKLSLDDKVVKYIPSFPLPGVTIRMLLSHTSGIEDYIKFMGESDWDKTVIVTNKDIIRFIADNKNKVQIGEPGKKFDYSNTNYVLLATIIEAISGESYSEYLTTTFFKPLKMDDTYVLNLQNYPRSRKSYYKNGKRYELRYLDLVYGDKNVYSTVRDLKKWDEALRKGLFKKSTLDLAYGVGGVTTAFVSSYGLGWKKITNSKNQEMLYHNGWWAGNRCLLIRLPDQKVVIAVVSNRNFTNIADIRKLCDLFGDYQQSTNKVINF